MKQQTAIEWLAEQLKEYDFSPRENTYLIEIPSWIFKEKLNQSKQMEREQHGNTRDAAIKSHDDRGYVHFRSLTDFGEYVVGS